VEPAIELSDFINTYVREKATEFEANKQFAYSNSNYAVLTYILENDTRRSWITTLGDRIFTPARMTRSGVAAWPATNAATAGFAQGLINDRGKLIPAPYIHHSWPNGAGAIYSTTGDLFNLHRTLQDGTTILAYPSQRDMYTARTVRNPWKWQDPY